MEKNQQKKRVWIIANRLPFTIEFNELDEINIRRSSGGLVNALTSYYEQSSHNVDKHWVGVAECTPQVWEESVKPQFQNEEIQFQPIFVDPDDYDQYYAGFSNATIWPLFHYFPSKVDFKDTYWEKYQIVNKAFAEQLLPHLEPNDIVWIHDYQLMLLPALLREKIPNLSIGFFLHIPFPSYEIFKILPQNWKKSIAEGLLGADLIGFHTYEYVQHFILSMKMILGIDNNFHTLQYQQRDIKAELFPLGIDYAKFSEKSVSDEVNEKTKFFDAEFNNKRIIFSVDRLDYSKGFIERLNGWELFLQMYPEWHGKVVFIMNIVPSRDSIEMYQEMKSSIEQKISTINGIYGSLTWQPIHYQYQHMQFDDLIALYKHADVALITPLRDGMNLVAKEFIASQTNGKGVLILSEFAGASVELNEALLVNPFDTLNLAETIHKALNLTTEEKEHRNKIMQKRLQNYDVIQWINDFIEQLEWVTKQRSIKKTNALDLIPIFKTNFASAKRKIFLLDYDGTLAPLTLYPQEANPSNNIKDILLQLSEKPDTKVVIISGRPASTLEEWLGELPITLVAEHGSIIKEQDGMWVDLNQEEANWKKEILPVMQTFVNRCVGSFIEEKRHTLAWHYRNTLPGVGFERSRELINNLQVLVSNTHLQVIDGNKVVEIKPTGYDKGIIANRLASNYSADFICCIGDDTTDEDMFTALNGNAITIKVKAKQSQAKYYLPDQTDVVRFLNSFTQ